MTAPREPLPQAPLPPATLPPTPVPSPEEAESEGMLDLDDHDAINNQHLEVR